jgi:hypothetical protein
LAEPRRTLPEPRLALVRGLLLRPTCVKGVSHGYLPRVRVVAPRRAATAVASAPLPASRIEPLFDPENQGAASDLESLDLSLDSSQTVMIVGYLRNSAETVMRFGARHHVSGGWAEVVAWLPVDALTLIATVVHALLAPRVVEPRTRQLRPACPRLLHPFTPMEAPALRCSAALGMPGVGTPKPLLTNAVNSVVLAL